MLRKLRRRALAIPSRNIKFSRRGFYSGEVLARAHLERVGETFVFGYHAALECDDADSLADRLNQNAEPMFRGFAFEGASMGLTLLDTLTLFKSDRLQKFMDGPARAHTYMVHVGVGWAFARLPWLRRRLPLKLFHLDPLLRWLVVDGFGFHEGYFHWRRHIAGCEVPQNLSNYALRAFDQGLGRSIWFVDGADARRISFTIAKFSETRQGDLWSGIGLACAYAGCIDSASLEILHNLAGRYQPQLAQGAAFAAKARQRAGNGAEHTDIACRAFCSMSADSAAAVTDEALRHLPFDAAEPAYEIWRTRIQRIFAGI